MGIITKNPKFTSGGSHLTGLDVKVNKLAIDVGQRILDEDDNAAKAAKASSAIRREFADYKSVMSPSAIETHKDKNGSDVRIISSHAFAPENVVQMRAFRSQQEVAQSLGELNARRALSKIGIDTGLYEQKGFSLEGSVFEQQGKENLEIFAHAKTVQSDIARGRVAKSLADIRKFEAAKRSAGTEAYADSLLHQLGDPNSELNKQLSGKMSNKKKKEEIDIVAKGTEKGIRKISGGNQVLSAASWLALGKLAQKGFGAVVGNEIRGAQFGQSMTNMALMSGADPETIAKWGFALKRFGGNEATASKLFAGITQLRQGALMGEDSPYMQAAMKYGLDLTGSGQGGIATEEEMLDRIAEFFRGDHTKEEKWHMAQILGMDASAQRLFSKDKSELDKILLDSSIVDEDTISNLNQTQEKYNELVSNLQQHLLVIADKTGVFDYWLDVAKSLSGVLESIEKYFEKEANKEFTEGTTIQDLPWYTRALLFFSGEDTSAIGGQSLDQKMALWSQIASPMAPVGMYTPFTTSSVNGNVDVTVTVKDQNGNILPSDTSSSVSAESVMSQAE